MRRISLMWILGIVFVGAMLAPTGAFAQISCSRDGLQRAVDLYIAAQTQGDTSGLPLATGLGYCENHAPAAINAGLIKTAMKIDHHRSLLDPSTCQTFTEVIVTDKAKPYVLGTRLRVNHDKIAEIEILWTTTGYWLFNADDYLKCSSSEKWDVDSGRPARHARHARRRGQRLPRRVSRREEGRRAVGLSVHAHRRRHAHRQRLAHRQLRRRRAGGVNIANRRFVVDETIGSVVVYLHLRRRRPERRQRRARHASLPRRERQAALRAHAHASAAVGFPALVHRSRWRGGRRGRPERWSQGWWTPSCGCSRRSPGRSTAVELRIKMTASRGASIAASFRIADGAVSS